MSREQSGNGGPKGTMVIPVCRMRHPPRHAQKIKGDPPKNPSLLCFPHSCWTTLCSSQRVEEHTNLKPYSKHSTTEIVLKATVTAKHQAPDPLWWFSWRNTRHVSGSLTAVGKNIATVGSDLQFTFSGCHNTIHSFFFSSAEINPVCGSCYSYLPLHTGGAAKWECIGLQAVLISWAKPKLYKIRLGPAVFI